MTKRTEDLCGTIDYENGGCDDNNNNDKYGCGGIEKEGDKEGILEATYEKHRDDQTNTGVIAALLGCFALTNSWEIETGEGVTSIELAAYTRAILLVHGCTCSALTSAFLYRSLTKKIPRVPIGWMERHHVLAQLPWYEVCSVNKLVRHDMARHGTSAKETTPQIFQCRNVV